MITLIKNATAIEFEPSSVRDGVDVVIEDSYIKEVGSDLSSKYQADKVIDGTGKLVYPGIVCSHNHYYSGLARGIMADIKPSPDFVSILRNLWWRLDRALDRDSLYSSGLVCALDAIKAGTTSVIDHHASPNFIKGSLNTLKQSFEEVGLRGMSCYEITDRNGRDGMIEGVEESLEFAALIDGEKDSGRGLFETHIGGHAPFTLNDEALKLMGDAVEKTGRGSHIHVAEGAYDVSYSHEKYGKDLIARLDEFGLLNKRSIMVHGVYLSDEDIKTINDRDAYLVHNARSNMNNGIGYNHRLSDYKNVALGTDGIGNNMFDEFKFAFFKHKDAGGPMWPDSYLKFLYNGNDILERNFGKKFGKLEAGYKADIVVADYNSPTPLVGDNIAGHIAFGMGSDTVRTVLIDGKVVLEDGEFPFDVSGIYAEAREQAKRLWAEMDQLPD
jgi:putative selenium metabolism protein SsnA